MHIESIKTWRVRIPLRPERRMISSLGRHDESEFVLVQVRTTDGIEGIGEATVTPIWSGETPRGAEAVIETVLAPQVLGVDPHDIPEIERRLDAVCFGNWFAKSAIEMACWDIMGKSAGKPVYELLGGAKRPLEIRCRFSLGAYTPEVAAERARERVAAGFTTIKVKVGPDPSTDVARVRAVREAIGSEIAMMIDGNGGWDTRTAIRCINNLEDCALSLVEQPTPRGDYGGLATVRAETSVPIMADEGCFDLAHAHELVRQHCCDVISLYPGKNGGIRKAIQIAEFAEGEGVKCSIGSNLEWDPATAAMAHFVVATPNMRVEEYPGDVLGPSYHEFSIARNPLRIEGPITTTPKLPGLGVEIDWSVVESHQCGSAV